MSKMGGAIKITESLIDSLILAKATEHEVVPEHWIAGEDESESYCFSCAEKEVERLNAEVPDRDAMVDGGWGSESDSLPYCLKCGKALSASLTTYGCEAELDHFEEFGFDLDDASDCYSMERIMGSVGFLDDELTPRIKRVIRKAIKDRERSRGVTKP